jgi:hypothetical protein
MSSRGIWDCWPWTLVLPNGPASPSPYCHHRPSRFASDSTSSWLGDTCSMTISQGDACSQRLPWNLCQLPEPDSLHYFHPWSPDTESPAATSHQTHEANQTCSLSCHADCHLSRCGSPQLGTPSSWTPKIESGKKHLCRALSSHLYL